jgi:cell division septation protein DedD
VNRLLFWDDKFRLKVNLLIIGTIFSGNRCEGMLMELKQRIIGLVVLLALGVILVPLIFDSEVTLAPSVKMLATGASSQYEKPATAQKAAVAYQAQPIKPAQFPTASINVSHETAQRPKLVHTDEDGNEVNYDEPVPIQDAEQVAENHEQLAEEADEESADLAKAGTQNSKKSLTENQSLSKDSQGEPLDEVSIKEAPHAKEASVKTLQDKLAMTQDDSQKNSHNKFELTNTTKTKTLQDKNNSHNKFSLTKDVAVKEASNKVKIIAQAPAKISRNKFELTKAVAVKDLHAKTASIKVSGGKATAKDSRVALSSADQALSIKSRFEQGEQARLSPGKAGVEPPASVARPNRITHSVEASQLANPVVWTIQLGSFSEKANANKLVTQLQSKGFHAFAEQDELKKNVHRVLIGAEVDRAVADQIVVKLQNQLNIKGIVVRYRG